MRVEEVRVLRRGAVVAGPRRSTSRYRLLRECDERGIAFVPFSPLGWPRGQHNEILTNSVVTTVARHHGATAGQVVLAWLLALAPNVLLIPGTSRRPHLRENLGAGALSLEPDEIVRLTQQFQ